jgi:hypothetical protein
MMFRIDSRHWKISMNTLHCDKFWAWFFAVLWRPFWKWRPVEILQCRESIPDIIIYQHMKFRCSSTYGHKPVKVIWIFMIPKTLKLFGFLIVWLWAYRLWLSQWRLKSVFFINNYFFLSNLFSNWTPFQYVYYTLNLIPFEIKNEVVLFLCAHWDNHRLKPPLRQTQNMHSLSFIILPCKTRTKTRIVFHLYNIQQ